MICFKDVKFWIISDNSTKRLQWVFFLMCGCTTSQKEDRLVLRDLKVWAEQFERDIARAQVAESSLQEKYQVSSREMMYDKNFLSSLCVTGTTVF